MNEFFVLIFKGILVFFSTNIDDFLLLLLFFAKDNSRSKNVIFGQYIGFATILVISLLASFSRALISPQWLSLLGIIPILVGIYKFRVPEQATVKINANSNILFIATLTIGDGWDNVSAYAPLFANETPLHVAILVGFFLLLLAAWCYIGSKVAQFAIIQKIAQKIKRFLPFIYILLGVVIIATHGISFLPFSFKGRDNKQTLPQAV